MGERPVCAAAGESYHQPPEWTQNPSVIVSGGSYNVAFDKQGAKKSLKRKAEDTPPTHPELQKTREKQGATYREMLKKNPQELPHIVKRLEDAAEGLENVTGDILPKNHAKKVKKEHDAGPISGSKFRGIVKGLDEFTQSEATSSFHKGARRRHGNTPPRDIPQVDRIVELSLRLQSADRAPTQTIYAPVDFQGNITGQQHPTSKDQPKLPGGSSGHSYSDRERVDAQNRVFDELSQVSGAPPDAVFLGSMLASNVSTLSHMSAPGYASNLPSFHQGRLEQQQKEREIIKKQTNFLAQQIHLPVAPGKQYNDAPWAAHDYPASPERMDESESLLEKNKPKFSDEETEEYQDRYDALKNVLEELNQAVNDEAAQGPGMQQLQQLMASLQQISRDDPGQQNAVIQLYSEAYQWLVQRRQDINRRQVGNNSAANNDLGARGRRYPALQQFFAECGQMVAYHMITRAAQLDYRASENMLNQMGNFGNDIEEADIRNMLETANRPDIPVIGSLQQMNRLTQILQNNNQQGVTDFNIETAEQQGGASVNAFLTGQSHELHAVVNTTGHLDDSQRGHHWIAVTFNRTEDRQIGVRYQDSLDYDADYTDLFTAYRQFFGHIPPNNQ
ncbi:hypothetical protein LJK88_41455 [Paenibacillus sp. P26]|nr:hypothetical protein LJK88_41455 [Paenibacillus sp. P26]